MLRAIIWLLVAVFSLAGLGIGSLLIFLNIVWWSSEGTDTDGGAGSSWMRERYHDGPRYFEVTAKLEVEGAPVEITRVMECEPYFFHRFGVGYFQKRWYLTNDAITHRLPDGSGVIIVVPKICEKFLRPQPADAPAWKAFPDFPDGFVPLVFWTADADNPEVLEGYHTFNSLDRPDSRVRFRSISLRNDPSLEPTPSPNEFGVMSSALYEGNPEGHRPTSVLNYAGYYLVSAEEENWKEVPELDAALGQNSEAQFLEPDLQIALQKRLRTHRYDFQYDVRGAIASRTRPTAPASDTPTANVHLDVYPVQESNDSLNVLTDRRGVILYRRQLRSERRAQEIRVSFQSTEFAWPKTNRSDSYFEPSSRTISELERSYLSFHRSEKGH